MLETQKPGSKTRSGEIGLAYSSPEVGQDQVSWEVSVTQSSIIIILTVLNKVVNS